MKLIKSLRETIHPASLMFGHHCMIKQRDIYCDLSLEAHCVCFCSLLLVSVQAPLLTMIRGSRKVSPYDFYTTDDEFEARMAELLRLEPAALEPASRAALASHERSYMTFCRSARIQAFPVSYVSLGLFFRPILPLGRTHCPVDPVYLIASQAS